MMIKTAYVQVVIMIKDPKNSRDLKRDVINECE